MSVPLAFIGVVLIWSTTPLAIKWSGEGAGFLFGVTSRMVLGMLVSLSLLAAFRQKLPLHAKALATYVIAGMGFFGAMMCVYWAAQRIPSGLVSVLFGLTPVVTGAMAGLLLSERAFGLNRVVGVLLGLAGLAVIFRGDGRADSSAWGIVAVLCSVLLHSVSMVWIKRINAALHPLATTSGALMVSVPLYLMVWLALDGQWPQRLPIHSGLSIVYLGLVGSVAGSVLFFYALKHVQAVRMGLIPLITPVNALFIGAWTNGEVLDVSTVAGAGLILSGLMFYEFSSLLLPRVRRIRERLRNKALAGPFDLAQDAAEGVSKQK
jgi:drug/metabolite transporter (DMT)-like permease